MASEKAQRRIAYVQFTNPGAYPPLEHSSRLLAERGWEVLFLGTESRGSLTLNLPSHPRIRVDLIPFEGPGLRQKMHYARFAARCAVILRRFRPDWLYVSDAMAAPVGLFLRQVLGVPIVYHEHDAPSGMGGRMGRLILSSRRKLARRARLCVLPNEERGRDFEEETGPFRRRVTVWNCPRCEEAAGRVPRKKENAAIAIFHGNLGENLLPETLFQAIGVLGGRVSLVIRGYDVSGTGDNYRRIERLREKYGLEQLELLPPVPRASIWADLASADLGLALFPMSSGDRNLNRLAGASNKVFDYLAAGVPVLVPDSPEWVRLVVQPGYGRACDTNDAASVADAVAWFLDHREEGREMGEAGRRRIESEWNYETQFEPVLRILEGEGGF